VIIALGAKRAVKVIDLLTEQVFFSAPLGLGIEIRISRICNRNMVVVVGNHPWSIMNQDTAEALERYLSSLVILKNIPKQQLDAINVPLNLDESLVGVDVFQNVIAKLVNEVKKGGGGTMG
jgi:hypothetical protein